MTQLVLDLPHRPAFGGSDFLVTPANRDAVAWIDRWPNWEHHALFLHGAEGAGKSHLANVWREKSSAARIAADGLNADGIRETVRAGGCVILEDVVETHAGEALLHLLNWVKETGSHLLMTGEAPPSQWSVALPDLASRLRAVPVAEIHQPDDELLAALLVKQFADRQLTLDPSVLAYLVPRMERSARALRRLVDALDKKSMADRRRITVKLAREVLAGLS